jgi:hypothetical protein
VTVDVTVGSIVVRVFLAVNVIVFVETTSTNFKHRTTEGYCGREKCSFPFFIPHRFPLWAFGTPRLILGRNPGSCEIGVNPAGVGTVLVDVLVVVVAGRNFSYQEH